MSLTQIDDLLRSLNIEFGFNPSAYSELPVYTYNTYFLLFAHYPINLPMHSLNKIVYMTTNLASFLDILKQYQFSIIVEWIRYINDFPLFCGKRSIANKMDLKSIRMCNEGCCLIRSINKTNLLKAIVDYLRVYDCEKNNI